MKEKQQQVFDVLKEKVTNIISLFEGSRKDNALLKEENTKLHNDKKELETKYIKLKNEYETLNLAKVVSLGREDSSEAKNRINNIVREIDKCIALLNN